MEKPYVLGLDMGGTNSVLGIVDARGHVLARTSIKTQAYTKIEDYVNALHEEAVKIIEPLGGIEMFRGIGNNLKRNFSGWNAWIIGPDTEDFDNIGLKPSLKIPLLNGSLECSLREYVLFNGRYNDFRADGAHAFVVFVRVVHCIHQRLRDDEVLGFAFCLGQVFYVNGFEVA